MAPSLPANNASPEALAAEVDPAAPPDKIIHIRPPTTTALPQPSTFDLPSLRTLSGTWHVTHSTLPMWKSKRNVRITYTLLAPSSSPDSEPPRLDDLVSYQTLTSQKVRTIRGIDTVSGSGAKSGQGQYTRCGEFDWRGKGWLAVASSHWEILGSGRAGEGDMWVVTYFARTLFTPAGIDIYSRDARGLAVETVEEIKRALAGMGDESVRNLTGELFKIERDDGREGRDE